MPKFKRKLNLEARSGLSRWQQTCPDFCCDWWISITQPQGPRWIWCGFRKGPRCMWWQVGTNIKLTLRCCYSEQKSLVEADLDACLGKKYIRKSWLRLWETKVKNALFKTEGKKSYSPSREDSTPDDWFGLIILDLVGFVFLFSLTQQPHWLVAMCALLCMLALRRGMWIHEH